MTPELESKIVTILDSIASQAQSATDAGVALAREQLPLVAREIVLWGILESALWAAFYAVLPLAFLVLGRRIWRWALKYADESDGSSLAVAGFVSLVMLLPLIGVVESVSDATKPLIAPRVYLIDWCAERMK